MERGHPLHRVFYLAFALGTLHALILIGIETYRWRTLSQETARLEVQNQSLWERVRKLEAELSAMNSRAAMEAEARRLGLVKRDETLYPRTTH